MIRSALIFTAVLGTVPHPVLADSRSQIPVKLEGRYGVELAVKAHRRDAKLGGACFSWLAKQAKPLFGAQSAQAISQLALTTGSEATVLSPEGSPTGYTLPTSHPLADIFETHAFGAAQSDDPAVEIKLLTDTTLNSQASELLPLSVIIRRRSNQLESWSMSPAGGQLQRNVYTAELRPE